jgi:hypothetical protein
MPLKPIEAFVPESLVLMHPSRYLSKWLCSKRDKNLTALLLTLNEPSSFEHFEMLCHGV